MTNSLKRFSVVAAVGSAVACAAVLPGAAGQPAAEEKECKCIFLKPQELAWRDGPASLPPGAQIAILRGNPAEEGPFVFRIRLPARYQIAPHFHPVDESVTVISGTFKLGKGEVFDRSEAAYTLPAGSFAMIPAEDRHFAWVDEPTVIQLHGPGPWRITYINPDDDPRNQRP